MNINNKTLLALCIALIGLIGSILGGRYSKINEQQITDRKIFDNCYSKIFKIMEYNFYSKELNLFEYQELGKQLLKIFDKSQGYFYPSLKEYAKWLASAKDTSTAQFALSSFSWTFDKQYTKVCSKIGMPKRSRYYRQNTHQYKDLKNLIFLSFFDAYAWINWTYVLMFILIVVALI
ncbi:hypothetical protein [Pediococcus stilesii]|uniref:Uncharacterized protein n=1 Tax=Pediococcus stilesii TaxID=331679 RepID=A0A0R2KYL7_9LACO|nr:hypothetical protein [Pediococcus stilesii]KRN94568.1 hypothetical protein IV81_GL001203 [Pediococcus stilesii]